MEGRGGCGREPAVLPAGESHVACGGLGPPDQPRRPCDAGRGALQRHEVRWPFRRGAILRTIATRGGWVSTRRDRCARAGSRTSERERAARHARHGGTELDASPGQQAANRRARRSGPTPRCGRRPGPPFRRHPGAGQQSRLRPESVHYGHTARRVSPACGIGRYAAIQSRDPGNLCAGIHVQAGRGSCGVERGCYGLGEDDHRHGRVQAAGPVARVSRLELDDEQRGRAGCRGSTQGDLPIIQCVLLSTRYADRY